MPHLRPGFDLFWLGIVAKLTGNMEMPAVFRSLAFLV